MFKKDVNVNVKSEDQVSPAALVVQLAGKFSSTIYIEYGTKKINAKSIMGVMTLPLTEGELMTVTAVGKDEAEAVEEIVKFLG